MKKQRANTFMIIDDDSDDRTIFSESVYKVDSTLQCMQASNGQDGLDKLLQSSTLPDYVFVDVNMPNMTGFEVLTKIRRSEKLKDLKVIIYTTSSQKSAVEAARSLGADGFLTKPEEVGELVKYLSGLVNATSTAAFVEVGLLAILTSLVAGF